MPLHRSQIKSIDSPELAKLSKELASMAGQLDPANGVSTNWPADQLLLCAERGVFRWFAPPEYGGFGWTARQIAEGYLQLGAACLTTTFVITQWTAAVRRIVASRNDQLKQELLPRLMDGSDFTTVGVSHLSTSRRHLGRPVLTASPEPGGAGYRLQGMSPWVTGARYADHLVVGAVVNEVVSVAEGSKSLSPIAEQVLLSVPTDAPGIKVADSQSLVALSASQTGAVHFQNVLVDKSRLLAGPVENVMASKSGSGTGGLQTSTLALALASAAIDFLKSESINRAELTDKHESLQQQWQETKSDLIELASGNLVCSNDDLRTRANSLVLRSTQATMVAAKGAGFVQGHKVGRWCQEALFFLVWSCPQSVLEANLCELAGIID